MKKDIYNDKVLVEAYKKRFAQILEYTMPNSNILGEDDEETPDAGMEGDEMPMNQMDNGASDEGGMDQSIDNNQMMGAEMPQDGNDAQMDGGEMPMDQMGGEMSQEGDLTSGFNPEMAANDNMGDNGDISQMQPDDEVIDITDLTDAQEETQEELDAFDKKFVKAIEAINGIEKMLKTNDDKIEALSAEIKKRNPTPKEKMSNRAAISYPFNVSPEDYWEDKEKNSNYSTEDDQTKKEFVIKQSDIDNARDWKNISDSMNDDFMYNQTLNKILNF